MIAKQKEKSASGVKRGLQVIESRQQQVRVGIRASEEFLRHVMREMRLGRNSVSLRFVTDREMAQLNQTFRKEKGTTDVLSFPSEERSRPVSVTTRAKELRGEFLGDIAISLAAARRNARSLGRNLSEEVHVLILHGVLHLLGYDHEADRGEMDRVEGRLRRRLGLA
jgi:probable rRNA maturation factor